MIYDREEVNKISEQFSDIIPVEIVVYHADSKKCWTTDESEADKSTVCAKKIKYLNTGNVRYYIKRCGSEFFDNTHISPIYKRKLWKMGPVIEFAFKLYIQFLGFEDGTGRGKLYLKHKAERLV